jgi:hypothetical protein
VNIDPIATLENVRALVAGQLALRYAGFRLAGSPGDKDVDREIVAVAGIWPHEKGTPPSPEVTQYRFSIVLGLRESDAKQKTEQFRQTVLNARLRPDIVARQAQVASRWQALTDVDQATLLADAEQAAREANVPLCFILFSEVMGPRRSYVQLWHSKLMPSVSALSGLQNLYRQSISPNN